jgi:uncharacterized protein (DUF736 family)
MIIGNFKKTDDNGFRGVIRTLTLNLEVAFEPIANKTGEKVPDYRVTTGHTELGAAWTETSEKTGNVYLSVRLDDPALPAPIGCALVKTGTQLGYSLVWERRRKAKTATPAKEF